MTDPSPGAAADLRAAVAAALAGAAIPEALGGGREADGPAIDHVGLIAPPGIDAAGVASILAALGAPPRVFPSRYVAAELSARAGRPIAADVVLARGPGGIGVEVFVAAAPPALVRAWVDAGVSAHVCLRVRDVDALDAAARRLERAGLRAPPFMPDGPVAVDPLGVVMRYLDGRSPPARVELLAPDPRRA